MKQNFLTIDTSIIYRSTQKFFDNALAKYNIGYGQVLFLTLIYENEGITMNQLSMLGSFDKGTITKSIQRLIELDYIKCEINPEDKRHKNLYTTNKCQEVIHEIYLLKQQWYDNLLFDLNDEEIMLYLDLVERITDRAREYQNNIIENKELKIFGHEKLSLVDYPNILSSVIFTGGCNFRCPFCHNKQLVFLNENLNEINSLDILDFIKKRKNVIDGICISGGEPLIHPGLADFLRQIKEFGLKIKLDTNGSLPSKLNDLIKENLVDYVAMDIKNSKEKYAMTIDIENFDISPIQESINLLMNSQIDYEFRTTFVKEFHNGEDVKQIGQWLKGAKKYYIQSFKDNDNVIRRGLSSFNKNDLIEFKNILNEYINDVEIRGVE